ncbi:MAG: diaminopimelate decarboxylase [Bacteroidota bacterium]|nr:diaminopimelate decarboxylase [Bacteroidota bacterium]
MNNTIIEKIKDIETPFYLYNTKILNETLNSIQKEAKKYNFIVHYALKANANKKLLEIIRNYDFGADCVSGNEIQRAINTGFSKENIVYAGVGKSDKEISLAIDNNIYCFNCESEHEIEIINNIAANKGKIATIALRINPNIDANTHHYITTGIEENKFGINIYQLDDIISKLKNQHNIKLIGLHFHIGSQIRDFMVFKNLCLKINKIQKLFIERNIYISDINVGGGLGIDYENPENITKTNFHDYFKIFNDFLELLPKQKVHFELGRSVVAQCGSLITKVLYIKKGVKTNFAIVDAGMTELIRPALYQAYHKIDNLSSNLNKKKYDIVGPICESADYFGKAIDLHETKRNDLIIIHSSGAYGQSMASQYNLRDLVRDYYI